MNSSPFKSSIAFALAGALIVGVVGWRTAMSTAKQSEETEAETSMLRHEGSRLVVPQESPLRQVLQIDTVNTGVIAATFSLPAAVEVDPAKLVKVLTPLSGRILSLNKRLGDTVKAGDVLFTIESADLGQAFADAAKAQAALGLAKRNLERQRGLDQADIAAKRDVEQAQNDYDQALSESARSTARLTQLGAKGGAQFSGNSAVLSVRAPIAGRVVDLNAAIGGYWNDTTAALMTVADLSTVFITANAQEKDLAQIYAGQEVSIKLDAYAEPLAGTVKFVGEMLDPDTRTVKVRLLMNNRDGRLKPGMFAQASLRTRPHPGLLVPMSAVLQSGFYNRAFVEAAPWQFEARNVTLGMQVGNQIEVLNGLKAGDRLVVKEGVLLND